MAVAYQHVQQLLPILSSVTPDIPETLGRVTMKALAKDREQRYSSAGSMLVDLMRAPYGGNMNAPETAAWAQTQTLTPIQDSPAQGTSTQILPSTAFQPVATAISSIVPASEEPEEIEKKKSKKKVLVLVVLVLVVPALIGDVWYALQLTTKPNATVIVPDNLVNMIQQDVQAVVEAAGPVPTVDPKKVPSDTAAESFVVETDPPSGTMVAPGSVVKAKISSSSDSVTVPDNLINMNPEEAKQAVEALGLVRQLFPDQTASDTVENGKITQVNLSPGSKVKKGQTITSIVSSGAKSVAAPDLTGMTQDQAREVLAVKGLKVGSVPISDDAPQRKGLILFSPPRAGASVNKGESVPITLPSGKVTIPDTIIGYGKSFVTATLRGLTLSVTVIGRYPEGQPAGTVIAVNPAEGPPVAQNSNVFLTVSKGSRPKNQDQPGQNNDGQVTYESPPMKGPKG